jgi:hypothetical protein
LEEKKMERRTQRFSHSREWRTAVSGVPNVIATLTAGCLPTNSDNYLYAYAPVVVGVLTSGGHGENPLNGYCRWTQVDKIIPKQLWSIRYRRLSPYLLA